MVVLVTGANGQLGRCIFDVSKKDESNKYIFFDRERLDITKYDDIELVFHEEKPDFVVNCAAYTNVNEAERNPETAYVVNSDAVKYLTMACSEIGAFLIHISTDFVFGGSKTRPYTEKDAVKPLNQYGMSKLSGEKFVLSYEKGIVIRTSWLYSEYGNNFYKTMLERIRSKKETMVVNDQIGTPTYASDLANAIVTIINSRPDKEKCGLYHFSNEGCASWYDFASSIEVLYEYMRNHRLCTTGLSILPTTTKKFGGITQRPKYSIMDKTKIEREFGVKNRNWIASLSICMNNDLSKQGEN